MIEIIENSDRKIIVKHCPTKHWIAFILVLTIVTIINCQFFSIFPISSSLTCSKNWLNLTNCEIIESSLFEPDFRYQLVNNIDKPKFIFKGGIIWLGTEVDLFHNQIKNVYYPSNDFLGLFNLYLDRSHGRALQEVNQITEYIRDRDNEATLTLARNKSPFFYISFLLLPLIIMYPISIISLPPAQLYEFNLQEKYLVTKTKIMFAIQEDKYPFDNLKIESSITIKNKQEHSMSLYVNRWKLFTCDRFTNEREALKIINLLKQHIS